MAMIFRKPRDDERGLFDRLAPHPLQTWAWGDFREQTGVEVVRLLGFEGSEAVSQMQLTFHPIPKTNYTLGYYPKGSWTDEIQLETLMSLGKQKKALAIKLEPNISSPLKNEADILGLRDFLLQNKCVIGRPLFTPYSFIIDLRKSEDELMSTFKSKTRYNIKVAQKHLVEIVEDSTDNGFKEYLELLQLTTKRQQFYAHGMDYQTKMWQALKKQGMAHILKAVYKGEALAVWILFQHNYVLYYPYGASSRDHRDKMASNLLMWEAIKFGQRRQCSWFDLWGALSPDADPKDPWYGFHSFKAGYGGSLAEFVGSYDLVIEPQLYKLYRIADRWRWRLLRIKSKLPL